MAAHGFMASILPQCIGKSLAHSSQRPLCPKTTNPPAPAAQTHAELERTSCHHDVQPTTRFRSHRIYKLEGQRGPFMYEGYLVGVLN